VFEGVGDGAFGEGLVRQVDEGGGVEGGHRRKVSRDQEGSSFLKKRTKKRSPALRDAWFGQRDQRRRPQDQAPMGRRFLVLFFKKEPLSSNSRR
jgi:hypothetical protein